MKILRSFLFGVVIMLTACGCRTGREPAAQSLATSSAPSSTSSVQMTASGGHPSLPESLGSLNKLFLEGYRQRQGVVRSNSSPVIVANFNVVILYWNGTAETNRAIPDIYNALKTVAHVPFGIFLRVDPYAGKAGGTVPDEILADLKKYRESIGEAEASLSGAGYSPAQLARQQFILGVSKDYINEILVSGKAPRRELLAFARNLGPFMLAVANEAAAAQIDMTHEVVMRWKKKVPPEAWKQLVVVVRGPQMPRRLNIFTQYFARVLGEQGHDLGYPLESRRLIYAESISKDRDHLDLMATTIIDGDASEAFFGDRLRLSRDVLADGARERLKVLKFE